MPKEDEVLLASIPHTGTKFLEAAIRREGYSLQAASEFAKYEKTLYFTHIDRPDSSRLAYYMMLSGITTVMPFRHPYVTAVSWECRNMKLWPLVTMYERFFRYFMPRCQCVVPIDGSDDVRRRAIQKLNIILGINSSPDWSEVINPYKVRNHNADLRYYDVQRPSGYIVELVNEHMPELFRLGYYEGTYI
ncbi:MAG: hypothetical protein GTO00_09290 [Deltaproteobacteria bacterium]|nr:hypothetical protein [Deltaproteobacteria bacterium]